MNRLPTLAPTYARLLLRSRCKTRWTPSERALSTSQIIWSRQHLVYPATPTKTESYATPVLQLPDPPVQPASKALLVLYVPYPPGKWPSHLEMEDEFVDRVGKVVALNRVRLVVAYDGSTGRNDYRAKLLVPGGLVKSYPTITQSTITSPDFLATLASINAQPTSSNATPYTEILVCTHGARDCRCSDIGGDLVLALHAEVKRRGEDLLPSGEDAEREEGVRGVPRWKITECAHVGGHKWAANAILLPSLTFLSNLRPSHAPLIIDALANPETAELKRQLWKEHFRGVIGKGVEEQVASWEEGTAPPPSTNDATVVSLEDTSSMASERIRLVVRFTTHDGETHDVRGYEGESLMEIAKREGLGAVEGTCGGHCECATCHMYIPYKLIDPPYTGLVPDLTDAEEDMLDYALGVREEESRLGCRIVLNKGLSEWSLGGKGVELPQY